MPEMTVKDFASGVGDMVDTATKAIRETPARLKKAFTPSGPQSGQETMGAISDTAGTAAKGIGQLKGLLKQAGGGNGGTDNGKLSPAKGPQDVGGLKKSIDQYMKQKNLKARPKAAPSKERD